jgi:uncharacterized Zn finger protein
MPQNPIPCPSCGGAIKVRNSGALLSDDRTGLLMRECLVRCKDCGRDGKMLVTLDVGLYLDDKTLPIEPAPLPVIS